MILHDPVSTMIAIHFISSIFLVILQCVNGMPDSLIRKPDVHDAIEMQKIKDQLSSEMIGASWWWNKEMSANQLQDNQLHYFKPSEVGDKFMDGGYRDWWWKMVLDTFKDGVVVRKQDTATTTTTTVSTQTTTTTTAAPPTPVYPPLPATCSKTQLDSLGPFYWPFVPFPAQSQICPVADMASSGRLDISGYVLRSDCKTVVSNAKVEVWQANSTGQYNKDCVGYVMTDERGFYNFTASTPGVYIGRPRHIHYQVTKAGDLSVRLVTQMYLNSDVSAASQYKVKSLTVDDTLVASNHRKAQFNFIL